MNRREFIKLGSTSLLLLSSPWSALATNNKAKGKFIWVILRGGLDSLHTVIPTFESPLAGYRPSLYPDLKNAWLPITQGFALHPSLTNCHQLFMQNELSPVVAVSTGYQSRSHFDGQDFMEAGTGELNLDSGWLARACTLAQTDGVAIAKTTPIAMRGSDLTSTWFPSKLKAKDTDVYQSILTMYQNEPELAHSLSMGLEQREIANLGSAKSKSQFTELAKACANLMKADANLNTAVLELNGWDTHNRQSIRLKHKLSELDAGLAALKEQLGDDWDNTLVAVSTEFGRTVKENGSKGTDHGTASAMFFAGGQLKGGQVLGTWPGLASNQLYQERDLTPTSAMFDWLATGLQQHWQLPDSEMSKVFPSATLLNQTLFRR